MNNLIWVDYTILAIIGLSALISVVRGFLREALSLFGWVLAFWLSVTFTDDVAALFEGQVSVPSVRHSLAVAAIFVTVLLATGIVIYVVGLIVDKTGLSGTDRMLGVVFGIGRGAVIVAILVLLAGFTPLPQDPWWKQSTFLPHFEQLATQIRALLPPEISQLLTF